MHTPWNSHTRPNGSNGGCLSRDSRPGIGVIDVVGELDKMGLLDDGGFSLRDSNEWAYQTFLDAGYDAEWVLLPDSTHTSLSSEAPALPIDTVVDAEWELEHPPLSMTQRDQTRRDSSQITGRDRFVIACARTPR